MKVSQKYSHHDNKKPSQQKEKLLQTQSQDKRIENSQKQFNIIAIVIIIQRLQKDFIILFNAQVLKRQL